MRGEITAPCESNWTAIVERILQFNGPDKLAVGEEHVATVIKYRGPDLGGKPQILDGFRQNDLSSE
jgi:hypothetical protein